MSIPAQFTGEPVEVALNGKYLKDFLDVVPENDLEFQLNDPQSVILLAAAAQPRAFQYVCMPLNT